MSKVTIELTEMQRTYVKVSNDLRTSLLVGVDEQPSGRFGKDPDTTSEEHGEEDLESDTVESHIKIRLDASNRRIMLKTESSLREPPRSSSSVNIRHSKVDPVRDEGTTSNHPKSAMMENSSQHELRRFRIGTLRSFKYIRTRPPRRRGILGCAT